jgi:two-component system, NarL family, nitrate/nitrite response regulator NarL
MPLAKAIPIIVADRNVMASQLLAESLRQDQRFEVAALAPPAKILQLPPPIKPGVAVISGELDSGSAKGMLLARSLRAKTRDLSIVILLDSLERESVIASFRSGAKGVFCRTQPLSEFRSCIERVSQGQIWAPRTETEFLLEALESAPSCDGLVELSKITRRETEVAELAAQGLSNRQIAQQLCISEHTVKNHLFRIFDKLHVSNRIEMLFLMVNGRNSQLSLSQVLWSAGFNESAVVEAAEEGSLRAQCLLGFAHLEGRGVKKDDQTAYHWLRMAELNSVRLLEQSRSGINELKSRLESQEIQQLEQQVCRKAQQIQNVALEPLGERANKNPHRPACELKPAESSGRFSSSFSLRSGTHG